MKTPNSVAAGPAISPERLKTLADGVFAIVMTLLVLELGVDTLAVGRQDRDRSDGFAEGKPASVLPGPQIAAVGSLRTSGFSSQSMRYYAQNSSPFCIRLCRLGDSPLFP